MDLEDKLPDEILVHIESIGEIKVGVEYPWRPVVCSFCHQIGHKEQECGHVKKVWRPVVKKPAQELEQDRHQAKSVDVENLGQCQKAQSPTQIVSGEATAFKVNSEGVEATTSKNNPMGFASTTPKDNSKDKGVDSATSKGVEILGQSLKRNDQF